MSTFLPKDKWVPLQEWLTKIDSVLDDWDGVKSEADKCLNSSS